ncbi:MAG: alpha/beta hydrolase [Burkholderiaceae bacterium]|jgi:pimeloyl-ACP methyl ester carboxylesterase|nr:alpha/beta hydrolase [Burkholderiaceae bacterium]
MRVKVNGVTIEYEDIGPADRPAILLVMGLGMQLVNWPDEFVQGLVDMGLRVIRFDNRDAGMSQNFSHTPEQNVFWQILRMALRLPVATPYTVQDMAQDAVGLLDALGVKRAHVAGASLGGMIAQRIAATNPSRVISLSSISSWSGARRFGVPILIPHPGVTFELIGFLPSKVRRLDKEGLIKQAMSFVRRIGGPGVYEDGPLREMVELTVSRGFDPSGMIRQLLAILDDTGVRPKLLSRINCPTLVLHGDKDPFVPFRCGVDTAKRISGARFVSMPGSGHDVGPSTTDVALRELKPFIQSAQAKESASARR